MDLISHKIDFRGSKFTLLICFVMIILCFYYRIIEWLANFVPVIACFVYVHHVSFDSFENDQPFLWYLKIFWFGRTCICFLQIWEIQEVETFPKSEKRPWTSFKVWWEHMTTSKRGVCLGCIPCCSLLITNTNMCLHFLSSENVSQKIMSSFYVWKIIDSPCGTLLVC